MRGPFTAVDRGERTTSEVEYYLHRDGTIEITAIRTWSDYDRDNEAKWSRENESRAVGR